MLKFVTVSTTCPHCGSSAALILERTASPTSDILVRLAGTRLRCRNGSCKKLFGLQPEQATIRESQ